VAERLVLQCASVLGNRCALPLLRNIAGDENMSALTALTDRELIATEGDEIEIFHPFIRDLVEAFIPAQARKELHARTLEMMAEENGSPLEVRAYHAYQAGEIFNGLMMLERMGNLAFLRGDLDTAVFSYQRGLELARRELLETGDTTLDAAIATFSRKLGAVLARRGDATGADGVLREAIELTDPLSLERVRMLIGLGKVVAARKRFRDAYRLLGQALDIATRLESDESRAEVYLGIASVRREDRDYLGAAAALWEANELLEKTGADAITRAATAVDLAVLLIDDGDLPGARSQLDSAEPLAREAEAPYLQARVVGMLAHVDGNDGNSELAVDRYREAIRVAAEAGDAEAVFGWENELQEYMARPSSNRGGTLSWER
jgi:tetratricopeptide (TPR) repeat protein